MTEKRGIEYFITGTGTGVGKTFVAASMARSLVARGFRVGVYKPVLSGCSTAGLGENNTSERSRDDDFVLWEAAGRPRRLDDVSPQRFQAPVAPHLAAQAEGKSVDPLGLRLGIEGWRGGSDFVLVEGAGGLFSPISQVDLNADLAADFQTPLIVVTANVLGTIHATLATIFAAKSYRGGLLIAAVVLNDVPDTGADESRRSNLGELTRLCSPIPVIAHSAGQEVLSSEWDSIFGL